MALWYFMTSGPSCPKWGLWIEHYVMKTCLWIWTYVYGYAKAARFWPFWRLFQVNTIIGVSSLRCFMIYVSVSSHSFTQIAVFRVDVEPEPSMQLITKVNKDFDIKAYSAEGDLLWFASSNYDVSKQYVAIRKMASTPDQVEQEMTIEISGQKVRIISPKKSEPWLTALTIQLILGTAIIPPGKLLVSTESRLLVYNMPSFEFLGSATLQMPMPVWESELPDTISFLPWCQAIHPTPDECPEGHVIFGQETGSWQRHLVRAVCLKTTFNSE